jgi:putative DNA primase/helicase
MRVIKVEGTVERATGRWREILPQLGVDPRFLTNRHGPCPICGGKDRFRWDDRDGTGSYFCNQCGPGPGLLLIRKLHGWDHVTACRAVDQIIRRDPLPARPAPASRSTGGQLPRLEHVLSAACTPELVEQYLRGRGLSVVPAMLRGHARLAYHHDGEFTGMCPAMVAPVLGPDGRLQSVHRTYLANVPGKNKKLMPAVETVRGGAVRRFEPTDDLGIAEGIETAIAAHELFGLPTWATISSTVMESFVPPAGVRRLTIFADHDTNFAGQLAAFTLARHLHNVHRGLVIEVKIPPVPGSDWLDVLNGVGSRER